MTRAVPVATAVSARARAEATCRCGESPRYGSTSCDGSGSTALATALSSSPSSAARKKRVSAAPRLRLSVGGHDVQDETVGRGLRAGRNKEGPGARRQAGHESAVVTEPGTGRRGPDQCTKRQGRGRRHQYRGDVLADLPV